MSIFESSIVEDVMEVYLPVMWFGVTADLDDKLLGMIRFTMIGPWIGSFCFFLMFATGIAMVARSAIKYSKMKSKSSNNEQRRDEETAQGKDTPSEKEEKEAPINKID